ncbi:hypothetical protein NQ317_017803 [Molorchus minor]|uniref:Regulatory protein zeste n=1 Tax=Molorchus minor TaxID=1323400 RepID=A0ABQ9K2D9_9CUCU|nr:hypothetical protein NQ317_017803 [Molorchus minor]
MDTVEYIKSNKGGVKIIYMGYMYTVHKNKKCGGIRWRCAQRSLNCKGSISTGLSDVPQINMPHNHLPDYRSVEMARSKFGDKLDFRTLLNMFSLQKEAVLTKMAEAHNRKVRKSNFSPEEIDVLVNTVVKHYNILYGELAKRAVNKNARERAWIDVTRRVNRVSIERRTLQEVKNKWKKCQYLYRGHLGIPKDPVNEMKSNKSKHRANKTGKRIKIRQCSYYEPDFKKAVVLYAEQKSTSEAKRRYGISESNIRRWRRLKNDIIEKAAQARHPRRCKRPNSILDEPVDELYELYDHSNSLGRNREKFLTTIAIESFLDYVSTKKERLFFPDSMPLEQRATKLTTDEPVLQSQPLSPTKLKVTRQTNKPPQPSPKPVTPEPVNEEVCLRWNSHHSNMQSSFPNLLLREQYIDATLVADGQTLKCHRLILSSCSPYFEEVLSGISPYQHPVLFMKDVPFWILKSLCDFMYAGEVHIYQDKLEELLAVAETLKIKGLAGKQECGSEEVKSEELIRPIKEEHKKDDTRDRKKQPGIQQNEMSAPRSSKSTKNIHSSNRRNERTIKEPLKMDNILDPLDLLEPVYEELTKHEKPASVPAKFKESKAAPVRKSLPKKLKKKETV